MSDLMLAEMLVARIFTALHQATQTNTRSPLTWDFY
jgi:hypothetical protein